jgi:hypothetical protein
MARIVSASRQNATAIAGLDPAIQPIRKTLRSAIDAWVKPARDGAGRLPGYDA